MAANARLDEHAVQLCLVSWQRGYDSGFRGEVGKCPKDAKLRSFAAGFVQGTHADLTPPKFEREVTIHIDPLSADAHAGRGLNKLLKSS
jgi:hypothetical protein